MCPFETWALHQDGPCCPFGAWGAAPAAEPGLEHTCVSGGYRPAEQRGHLLIRHALLLSHTYGLTKVDSQDVFALGEKSTGVIIIMIQ